MDSKNVSTTSITRLTHDNHVTWKERLVTSLMMNHVWSVTTGAELRPAGTPEWLTEDQVAAPETLSKADRDALEKYRKIARKWDEKNEYATGIMITSVGDQHLAYVSTKKSAVENWESLEAFGATLHSGVSAFYLKSDLYKTKYVPGTPMVDHLAKIDVLQKRLAQSGNTLSDKDLAEVMIMSLPDDENQQDWKSATSNITALPAEVRTPGYVHTRLLEEAARINGHSNGNGGASTSNTVSALVVHRGGTNNRGGRKGRGRGKSNGGTSAGKVVKCSNCGKRGHAQSDCWHEADVVKCASCHKIGHTENECWHKHPYLRPANKRQGAAPTANVAIPSETSRRQWHLVTIPEPISSDLAFASTQHLESSWIIDTGASSHIVRDLSSFIKYTPASEPFHTIRTGNNGGAAIVGKGTIAISISVNGITNTVTISDVYHVPDFWINLISGSQLDARGACITFRNGLCTVTDGSDTIMKAHVDGGLYYLDVLSVGDVVALANVASKDATLETWHHRLGCVGYHSVQKLLKGDLVVGMQATDDNIPELCESCLVGKQARKPFPKESRSRAKEILELVHMDVHGPEPDSIGRNRYMVVIIDDYSRKYFVFLAKTKDQSLSMFKQFKAREENQTGRRIKKFHTDNGGEFFNGEFDTFLKDSGIIHLHTNPHTPQQNGIVERANRTLMERVRCMLNYQQCPRSYWADAAKYAALIYNSSPSSFLNGNLPETAYSGTIPNMENFRVFGCDAYAQVPAATRSSLDSRTKKWIFVGFEEGVKPGWKLMDPQTHRCTTSRDVVFRESKDNPIPITEPSGANLPEPIQIDELPDAAPTPVASNPRTSGRIRYQPARLLDSITPEEMVGLAATIDSNSNVEDPRNIVHHEPQSYVEAMKSKDAEKWREAIAEEYKNLDEMGTFEIVDLPPGKRAIGNKLVFRLKTDESGNISRYKARLVALGNLQREGIDYNEVFAPVVKMDSVRVLLSIAASEGMELYQFDIKNAYLNGTLEEEIYMRLPPGFDDELKGKVAKLLKSIYGLKQAGRVWNQDIDDSLIRDLGFKPTLSDPCIYVRNCENGKKEYIGIFVDDGIAALPPGHAQILRQQLEAKYTLSSFGPASHFLGMQITINPDHSILLRQTAYFDTLLSELGMDNCNSAPTPIASGVKLSLKSCPMTESGKLEMEEVPYLKAIGKLMYAMISTHPDLAFAVGALAQFSSNPGSDHWSTVKRTLRYLKHTREYGLLFKAEPLKLEAWTDSDWAGDVWTRRSIAGYIFKLGGGVISWSSKKQPTVALSTTEAEYMATAHAAKHIVWLRNLLGELGHEQHGPTTLYSDNTGSIALAKNPVSHARVKHIDIRHHFIRDLVASGIVNITYCPTGEMLADICTKSLSQETHEYFFNLLCSFSG